MGVCSVKLTKYKFSLDKITEIIEGRGGQVSLSTTPYAVELAEMEQQYWRFHSPWGNPGDKVYALENYRIDKVCQTANGYYITIKFEDGQTVTVKSNTPMAITAKDSFISSDGAVPDIAIRLRMIIQDVQLVGDNWVFTMALENNELGGENA